MRPRTRPPRTAPATSRESERTLSPASRNRRFRGGDRGGNHTVGHVRRARFRVPAAHASRRRAASRPHGPGTRASGAGRAQGEPPRGGRTTAPPTGDGSGDEVPRRWHEHESGESRSYRVRDSLRRENGGVSRHLHGRGPHRVTGAPCVAGAALAPSPTSTVAHHEGTRGTGTSSGVPTGGRP